VLAVIVVLPTPPHERSHETSEQVDDEAETRDEQAWGHIGALKADEQTAVRGDGGEQDREPSDDEPARGETLGGGSRESVVPAGSL